MREPQQQQPAMQQLHYPMHYLMVCMPQEHTYSTLVSLPVGSFSTTAVWLLELYPANIVQTFH